VKLVVFLDFEDKLKATAFEKYLKNSSRCNIHQLLNLLTQLFVEVEPLKITPTLSPIKPTNYFR